MEKLGSNLLRMILCSQSCRKNHKHEIRGYSCNGWWLRSQATWPASHQTSMSWSVHARRRPWVLGSRDVCILSSRDGSWPSRTLHFSSRSSMWCPVQDANPEQAWKHGSPSRSRVRGAREWWAIGLSAPGLREGFPAFGHPQCLTIQLFNPEGSAFSWGFCPPMGTGPLGWGCRNNFSEDLLLDKHRHSRYS